MQASRRWQWLRLREGPVRRALQLGLFPILMIGLPLAALPLFEVFSPVAVGMATLLGTIPLFFVLERMFPWSERWIGSHGDVHADVGLTLLAALASPLVQAASQLGALWILLVFAGGADLGLWPKDWPLLAQAALSIVVADFFRYWFHRASHQWPWLWRLHATHHSAERLYFYNGARIHPLEVLLTGVVQGVPVVALGIPAEALALNFVIARVIGRFQHCNLDVHLGPLDYVFSSPKNHRWHHSRNLSEAACNYGGDVIVWDHVFGTFFLPDDREPSDEIGIGDMPGFPSRLDGVLLTPFTWARYLLGGPRPAGHA